MKKLFVIFTLLSFITHGQICSSYKIEDSLIVKVSGKLNSEAQIMSGTCASPDGPMNYIAAPPGSYASLLAGGYCYAIGPQKNFTMCFTFTASGTTATLNAGYSSSGCASISFSGFNLYTCAPACTAVGTGLTFAGLTPGQCYTWCFSGSCTGPGPGFDHVCPYWQSTTPLPIELLYFKGYKDGSNKFEWSTAIERNNILFRIERSSNAIDFVAIDEVIGSGTSNTNKIYKGIDINPPKVINYYRLKQVDFDGGYSYSNIIAIDNRGENKQPIKVYNMLGQPVSETYEGWKILIYPDGRVEKR